MPRLSTKSTICRTVDKNASPSRKIKTILYAKEHFDPRRIKHPLGLQAIAL